LVCGEIELWRRRCPFGNQRDRRGDGADGTLVFLILYTRTEY
jgi:hypothetical protein